MHQTRQFTKRRPQSPLLNQQQQSVDGLQVGVSKPILPRSGLAIQNNAPIHVTRSFSKTVTEQHDHDHSHIPPVQQEIHHHTATVNPYQPAVQQNGHIHQQGQVEQGHGHQHYHGQDNHAAHNHGPLCNDHHGHDNHGHDHHGHDHHGHDHHGHDHHGHDHHGHDHHGHDHHGHDHHGHDHHGHDHHHGHGHSHSHTSFPQVYTQPLPSYATIFASLAPSQKALFTCFLGHIGIGMILWFMGAARESLAIVGYSYLVLFDAFGTLNTFVSSVLHLNPAFTATCTKRPFGSRRFEIVFALGNTIFLLFGTMFTTKESLEHLLLETHHEGDHHGKSAFPFGLLFMLLVSIGASVASNVALKNHENLVNLIKKLPATHQEYSYHDIKGLSNMNSNHLIQSLLKNVYSLSIVSTGSIVFIVQLFGITSPTFDKFLAFAESALMLYLGGPTAAALARVLLQTMPDPMVHSVDHSVRLIRQQVPHVVSIDKVHFWQNAYGKFIGTLEIGVRPEAEEDTVIDASFDIMEPLIRENGGELTISVTKMQ